ncbi:MAG: thioredoxin family protein [Burkholderiaceae bacterium]|nr:thioredoxin family protein [Burkholderiaceae bacterium]
MDRRSLLITAGASALTGLPALARAATATVGQGAPAFTLSDTDGKPVKLADFLGRTVVLEWNNPGCPFVRKHYQGNMQALQKEATAEGVVWLAINSTETASSDYLSPAQLARWMQEKQAAPTATLMDEDGAVGRAYGARVTPHMYIIDGKGVLVYAGGIDSIPSARVDDIARATPYIRQSLAEIKAGKPLSTTNTQAYGCTIKYKS